jgi:DDE domain
MRHPNRPGGSTKPTLRWQATGPICIERSILLARRSSSCSPQSGSDRSEAVPPLGIIRWRTSSAGDQCGRQSGISASAIAELKRTGELSRRCRCRTAPYRNNIIEQDHRFIKKRISASLGFRSAESAWRTIEGYEAMHVIRKGQVRLVAKGDSVAQRKFIHSIFGVAA